MLRESAIAFGYVFDPAAIADPAIPTGIPGGPTLLRFVDALLGRSDRSLEDARRDIVDELGPEALVDAASVFGNFQMMNRVAEGTGIHISSETIEEHTDIVEALDLLDLRKGQHAQGIDKVAPIRENPS